MKFIPSWALLVIAGLALMGAHAASPGVWAQEAPSRGETQVGDFDRIRVDGPLQVTVLVGPQHAVRARNERAVRITVAGSDLTLTTASPRSSGSEVAVSLPSLKALTVKDGGRVSINAIREGGEVSFTVLNGAEIIASGATEQVKVEVRGAGRADLAALKAEAVSAKVEGPGRTRVFASRSLSASVAGDGSIEYSGNPATIAQAVSGRGTVTPF